MPSTGVSAPIAPANSSPLDFYQQQGGLDLTNTQNQADISNKRLDISGQGLTLQQQANQRALGEAPQYQGIQQNLQDLQHQSLIRDYYQYDPQFHALAEQGFGLQGQGLDIQGQQLGDQRTLLGLSGDELGLQRQSLGLQQQDQAQALNTGRRQISGNAAASGSTNAGWGQQWSDFYNTWQRQSQQLGLQGQGLDIQGKRLGVQGNELNLSGKQLDIARQQLGLNQKQYDVGYDQQLNQTSDQIRASDLSAQEQQLQYGDQIYQLQNQGGQLDLQAQDLGLSRQEVQQGLAYADQTYNLGLANAAFQTDLSNIMGGTSSYGP